MNSTLLIGALVILSILIFLLALIVNRLTRLIMGNMQNKNPQMRDHGLPEGEVFPQVDGMNVEANQLIHHNESSSVIFITSANCDSCKALYPVVVEFADKHPGLNIVLLVRGEQEEAVAITNKHEMRFAVVGMDKEFMADTLKTMFTPFAYFADETGIIQSKGLIFTYAQIETLINP
jgi:hypothetical protein